MSIWTDTLSPVLVLRLKTIFFNLRRNYPGAGGGRALSTSMIKQHVVVLVTVVVLHAGLCYARTRLQEFPSGVPCRSNVVPYKERAKYSQRMDEKMLGACDVPCPRKQVVF